MMVIVQDLTFKDVVYGRMETPWSLNSLFYKGISGLPIDKATEILSKSVLPRPSQGRVELAVRFYDNLLGALTAGRSIKTVKGTYQVLRSFYSWADKNDYEMVDTTIERAFLDWTDWLMDGSRGNAPAESNAFGRASRIATVIDRILDRDRRIMSFCRLRKKSKNKNWGKEADKINFEKLFKMGRSLLDICESLSVETIRGDLPALIKFRSGEVFEHWSKLIAPEKLKGDWHLKGSSLKKRTAWNADKSWRTRYPLMNLRIESEILIFVSQTQMNLSQALALENGRFSYQSFSDGYHCKGIYKNRKKGEVEFNIYSEYRNHFENYLAWRNEMYPKEGLLFPLASHFGRTLTNSPNFGATRVILRKLKIDYITPQSLRASKINWLLRKSRDPQLTAEMGQHEELTLLRIYEQPNHQAALAELSRYHQNSDPAFAPPGPGVCIELNPINMPSSPNNAPKPDCVNPAGCLYCEHQRDIAEFDHVWSLASYRYLKSLELASHRPNAVTRDKHPAHMVIELVTEKLETFKAVTDHAKWINESLLRIEEGRYHPKWDGFIRIMELRT